MKYLNTSIAVTGLMLCGAAVHADDATTPSGATISTRPSEHQMMKECMARQKEADASMSKADMKKACKEQVQAEIQNMSVPPTK